MIITNNESQHGKRFCSGLDDDDLRAPVIVSHPEDITLQEGDPIRLTCQIGGELPLSVNWFKEDEALDEAGEFLMTFDDQEGLAVLKVNESFAEDEGVYTCQATNAWGRTASSANLIVVTGEILIQWFRSDHAHLLRHNPFSILSTSTLLLIYELSEAIYLFLSFQTFLLSTGLSLFAICCILAYLLLQTLI